MGQNPEYLGICKTPEGPYKGDIAYYSAYIRGPHKTIVFKDENDTDL